MQATKLTWEYWSEDLSVGIAGIDHDHQGILELIAGLKACYDEPEADAVVRVALARIARYADRHFAREEAMLDSAAYPFLAQHRVRHDQFRAYVAGFAAGAPLPLPGELLSWLVDWWVGHIGTEDKMYRDHVARHPDAAATLKG